MADAPQAGRVPARAGIEGAAERTAREGRRRRRSRRRALVPALAFALASAGVGCAGDEDLPSSALVVVVDTLRADRLGLYGYPRDTSPHLDARAAGGVVFERAYSTSSWTLPAVASVLTGGLPPEHGARRLPDDAGDAGSAPADALLHHGKRFSPLAAGVPTLAERLAERGMATAAFVTNPFMEERFGLARGFERYDYLPRRPAEPVIDRAVAWLESADRGGRPFLLLLHLLEPHLPYDPPAPDRGRFSQGAGSTLGYPVSGVHALRRRLDELDAADRRFVSDAYDEEIAAVDRQLGVLFRHLDRLDLWRDTVVVVTSDHGEELFDHGGFEHGRTMYDETIRVPLVVWAPGVAGGRRTEPVSLADVTPTILEALAPGATAAGGGATSGVGRWRTVTGDGTPRAQPILASGALHAEPIAGAILWPLKAVAGVGGAGEAVFDLSRDPAELEPLSAPGGEAERLLALARRLAEEETRGSDAVELDEAVRDGLRDLGYLE